MVRWFLDWHRTPAWCAVCALVVVLLVGDMTRLPASLSWMLLVPTNNEHSSSEENENAPDEVLAATTRQRARCRLSAWTLLSSVASIAESPFSCNPLSSFRALAVIPPSAMHHRGLPLRC